LIACSFSSEYATDLRARGSRRRALLTHLVPEPPRNFVSAATKSSRNLAVPFPIERGRWPHRKQAKKDVAGGVEHWRADASMPGIGCPKLRDNPRWRVSMTRRSNSAWLMGEGPSPNPNRVASPWIAFSITRGGMKATNNRPVAVFTSDITVPVRKFTCKGCVGSRRRSLAKPS